MYIQYYLLYVKQLLYVCQEDNHSAILRPARPKAVAEKEISLLMHWRKQPA